MPVEDVVRWLCHDHSEAGEVTDCLREIMARPPRGDRRQWVQELRTRFEDAMVSTRQHMDTMEAGGYLHPILEARPSLAPQVELLKHEHIELKRLIDGIRIAVEELSPHDNLLMRDCCKRIENLLSWIERHQEHETHIVLYVFAKDSETH
ncbi:MAG: hemerythrin domain-containing protein [Planctomycetota bacterium]